MSQEAFEYAAGKVLGFGAGDFFQQLARRPALSGSAGQQVVQGLSREDEAEMLQLGSQIIARVRVLRGLGRVHRKPPSGELRRSSVRDPGGARGRRAAGWGAAVGGDGG